MLLQQQVLKLRKFSSATGRVQTKLMTWSSPSDLSSALGQASRRQMKPRSEPRLQATSQICSSLKTLQTARQWLMPPHQALLQLGGCIPGTGPNGADLPARTQSCELSSGALAVLWLRLMQPRPASDIWSPRIVRQTGTGQLSARLRFVRSCGCRGRAATRL